jgi:hypothetical protein
MAKPSYSKLADTLSSLIGAFSDIDALLDNYMSQCDATKAESRASKAANRVHAKAITICAAALTPTADDKHLHLLKLACQNVLQSVGGSNPDACAIAHTEALARLHAALKVVFPKG